MIRTRAYQGVRNASFSEYIAYAINDPQKHPNDHEI